MPYLKNSAVKKAIKEKGWRCSGDFLESLDRKVHELIDDAISAKENNDPKRKTVQGEDLE